MSVIDDQQRFEIATHLRHPSLNSTLRHQNLGTSLTSTTKAFMDRDNIEEEEESKYRSLSYLKLEKSRLVIKSKNFSENLDRLVFISNEQWRLY